MKGNDYEAWVQYAHNDLSVAMREMERTVNPRLRPYEVILYHCQQSGDNYQITQLKSEAEEDHVYKY